MKTWGDDQRVRLGVRWDSPSQNERVRRAEQAQLVDYVEANFPIAPGDLPQVGDDLPLLVHCPINPVASPHGVNLRLAEQVRAAADFWGSPWVGEHLCWAGPGSEGRLGYIVTPILCQEFVDVAARNARCLATFHGRPLALELGPVYQQTGNIESEMHFLAAVAEAADCKIIFDLAHWTASNRNLQRSARYGLDVLPRGRVVELHVAGVRPSANGRWWHDCHDIPPPRELLSMIPDLLGAFPSIRAVTFEHAEDAPEEDLMRSLECLRRALS